ncbi:MAG TPA: hypothetical protein VHY91_06595 [Pirellulales bacterium]|nr:hypothetical protein [Pirellulales bacterium]
MAPTESWLFAQAILGKPIPRIVSPEARARAKRDELERSARSSARDAEELRRIRRAEAQARRERESLEWAAQISTDAEARLRALQQNEAGERAAWRRAGQFYEAYLASMIEWDEPAHPREPKGTPEGGQWAPKNGGGGAGTGESPSSLDAILQPNRDATGGPVELAAANGASSKGAKNGEHSPAADPKAKYISDFDKKHDLSLLDALKDGKLSAGDISRMKFTDDEIRRILESAKKPGSKWNFNFYTAHNLTPTLRATAERDFPNLPGDEKYAMQALISNQRRARTILMMRNPAFQQYVGELYGLVRSLNAVHFLGEKGIVVATGKEPVLGGEASRLRAVVEMVAYLLIMAGVKWGISKIVSILAGPEVAGDITIGFKGGGKVTIRDGAECDPATLESAIERAAAGKEVEIKPPAPKPPRPSLTEAPRITDDPKAFRRWFDELTPDEFQTVWKNPKLRQAVEDGLRWPGGQHEWLMVGRTPKLKEWGLTADQIAEMRTPISRIRFKNPPGGHAGENATTTHNQILKMIDSSPDFATFKARLRTWANERLVGGADALPSGLRP